MSAAVVSQVALPVIATLLAAGALGVVKIARTFATTARTAGAQAATAATAVHELAQDLRELAGSTRSMAEHIARCEERWAWYARDREAARFVPQQERRHLVIDGEPAQ